MHPLFIKYIGKTVAYSRENRKNMTRSEKILWNELRSKNLGYKFLRQKPIDMFILDFYCSKLMLAIELDGNSHEGKELYDYNREKLLEGLGIKILRYDNNEVLNDLNKVIEDLKLKIRLREKDLMT